MMSFLLFRNETGGRHELTKVLNLPNYHSGRKTKFSMSLEKDIDIKKCPKVFG